MKSKQTPFLKKMEAYARDGSIPPKYQELGKQFYSGYQDTLKAHGIAAEPLTDLFSAFADMIREQCVEPYVFQPFHKRVREPFDYYQFGIDFLKPLVDLERSSLIGLNHVKQITEALEKGENAIFLANHQIEADPQALSVLLEDSYPAFAENLIFVAGERVITDPLAIPFSMGCNLLCIYSKRYIDFPPEQKMKKQLHNKRTMELMSALLSEGGKAIYVAPSGGRDRPNEAGVLEMAPFDPQSIEMLYLMTVRAAHPTSFYPLALKTYELLPPPQSIQVELGEMRTTKRGAIHIAFGPKIDMEHFPGKESADKHERRRSRAEYIYNLVRNEYEKLGDDS